jgi:hypothetical protein
MTGLERIQVERRRVIEKEGFTPQADRLYKIGELSRAAGCYEAFANAPFLKGTPDTWPFEDHWFKPSTAERNLEKAGQLYLAEVERLNYLIDDTFSPILRGHYQALRNRAADGLQRCARALDEMAKVTA